MNKICFNYFLAILFIKIFSTYSHVSIPPEDKELFIGFLDGSRLKTFLNLTSCENEFYELLIKGLDVIDGFLNNNTEINYEVYRTIGDAFILFSQFTGKCIETKERLGFVLNNIKSALMNPRKFLIGAMDNTVSFHVVKLYLELSHKIKSGELYESGKILGDLISYILNVDIGRSELSFYSEISEKNLQLPDIIKETISDTTKENNDTTRNILDKNRK